MRTAKRDVVGREDVLVVVEDDVLARRQRAVGREHERDVRVAVVEDLVLLLAGQELLELEAVRPLHAEQAVDALAAGGEPVDRQVLGLVGEVGDLRRVAELLGRRLRDPEAVGVLERRRRERGDVDLRVLGLGVLVGLRRILRDVLDLHPEGRRQRRAGVLGVGVDHALGAAPRGRRARGRGRGPS